MALTIVKTVDSPFPGRYISIDKIPGTIFFVGFRKTCNNWKEILDKIQTHEDLIKFKNEYGKNTLFIPLSPDKRKVYERIEKKINTFI
jgi:hypothetical protein